MNFFPILVLEGENGPGLLLRQDHQTSWSTIGIVVCELMDI